MDVSHIAGNEAIMKFIQGLWKEETTIYLPHSRWQMDIMFILYFYAKIFCAMCISFIKVGFEKI